MGLFGLGKKDNFVDLGEKYRKQQERSREIKEDSQGENNLDLTKEVQPTSPGIFGMFGGATPSATTIEESSSQENVIEKKRKLAKRLMDMTDKIEDLSNQIYHLQQRVEILERRNSN